jgi:pyruvate/2-oxoglutarate/acetoin dehydrogenase E1 component
MSAGVIDLRTIAPLDKGSVCKAVLESGRLLVIHEDDRDSGVSGELAAVSWRRGFRHGMAAYALKRPSPVHGNSKT